MVSLADVLKRDSEPLPGWLCSESPSFSRNDFFGSRTLYYPGSGYDGQPVCLCARTRAVHGLGGNWENKFGFGQGGILESIAKRYNQRPRWLLVGEGTEPWKDYNDVGADPEPGGQYQTARRLYTLNTS